jgi:DNA polymerase III epsilon subunit-like protein
MRYFIGDTETTGLHKAKAVEVAFIEIDPYSLDTLRSWQSLIDPEMPISPGATEIHGIHDHHVLTEPTIEEYVSVVMGGRIEDPCTFIAHNVKFDKPFFAPILNIERTFCTLQHVRRLLPALENHRLGPMATHFGVDPGSAHRAMDDVLTVQACLRQMLRLDGRDLLSLLNVPRHTIYTMPFGEHKDRPLESLPRQYRTWLLLEASIDDDLRYSLMQLRAAEI